MENDELFEVHLKRRILWWNGEKACTVRKLCGTLKTLHLEMVDSQGYVVAPFNVPDEYGYYLSEGLLFPIKEPVEFVEEFKAKQALLPQTPKQKLIDEFIEDYNDFCRSKDKLHWVPKKVREILQKQVI